MAIHTSKRKKEFSQRRSSSCCLLQTIWRNGVWITGHEYNTNVIVCRQFKENQSALVLGVPGHHTVFLWWRVTWKLSWKLQWVLNCQSRDRVFPSGWTLCSPGRKPLFSQSLTTPGFLLQFYVNEPLYFLALHFTTALNSVGVVDGLAGAWGFSTNNVSLGGIQIGFKRFTYFPFWTYACLIRRKFHLKGKYLGNSNQNHWTWVFGKLLNHLVD